MLEYLMPTFANPSAAGGAPPYAHFSSDPRLIFDMPPTLITFAAAKEDASSAAGVKAIFFKNTRNLNFAIANIEGSPGQFVLVEPYREDVSVRASANLFVRVRAKWRTVQRLVDDNPEILEHFNVEHSIVALERFKP
jgi:hypothetical protein